MGAMAHAHVEQRGWAPPGPHGPYDFETLPGLDAASAAFLDARMRADPNLGYYTFWAEFRGRFQRDVLAMHRRNWQQVKLTKQGTQPTFLEWAEFTANYLGQRAQVDNWLDPR